MNANVECGPENCPLTAWAALSPSERKVQRKAKAEQMYRQGFTMEQIAKQFGVTQQQISLDLANLQVACKSKHAKTETNPKGAGRHKGSTKPREERRRTTRVVEDAAASAVLDKGMTYEQTATQLGLTSVQQVKTSVAREEGRREAKSDPDVDAKLLSMTAQEKLDAAIRQHKRKLDLEFDERVRERYLKDLEEVGLPHYTKKIEKLERLIYARRGVMDKVTYNKIRFCLHSDHIQDQAMKRRYDEAFNIFNGLEKLLLDEKNSPTPLQRMPRTVAELLKRKAEVRAERQAAQSSRRAGRTGVSI
jgi:hypothetical protein